jgi:DNA (cytosine-5)-methyltransferase 1
MMSLETLWRDDRRTPLEEPPVAERYMSEDSVDGVDGSLRSQLQCPIALDLFAGCGGMSLGLENAGFRIIYANEINESAAATYARNFPKVNLQVGDIREVNAKKLYLELGMPNVDVISAGTPCQGFSIAGRRQATDARNLLYKQVLRFARAFRPKLIVIENVLGMLYGRNRSLANQIIEDVRRIGYHPRMRVLTASHYGVPQKRKRVFIISGSKAIPEHELFPLSVGGTIRVSAAIADLAFLGNGEIASEYRRFPRSAYQLQMRGGALAIYNHESTNHSRRVRSRFASIPAGQQHPSREATKKHTHQKLHPWRLSRTLTSISEDSIHYLKNRGLTVREMARLQSFPDKFEFMGPRTSGGKTRRHACPQYTQVANAVPPLMAEAVFRNLATAIGKNY